MTTLASLFIFKFLLFKKCNIILLSLSVFSLAFSQLKKKVLIIFCILYVQIIPSVITTITEIKIPFIKMLIIIFMVITTILMMSLQDSYLNNWFL